MGQMTYAVMLGCKMAPPDTLEEGWYSLIEEYKPGKGPAPATPSGDGDHDAIGFWVAVGASGKEGCPDLADFPLDGFASVKEFKAPFARATKAWEEFRAWAEKRGVFLPDPRLWMVQTEVA